MSKKKIVIIIGAIVVVAVAAAVGVWKFSGKFGHDSDDRVYVQTVSSIMGSNAGMMNRYGGIVEPQKTVDITAESERTIKEFFVKVGDTVEEGTPLFAYDVEELELDLAQAKLDNENVDIEISNLRTQITELQKEKDAAAEGDKFEYTTQIQTVQTQIRQAEYEKSSKQLEVDKIQKKIDNSEVLSTAAGVVKTLNDPRQENNNDSGSNATISILSTGAYRVKGTLDEQTISMISPGSEVIIRSRVDETQTWKGTVDNVDTGETASGSDEDGMMGETSENAASKYPFYVSLENIDGLILGQHVYIELDMGQDEVKEGLWLYASYIDMGDADLPEENGEAVYMENVFDTEQESVFDTETDIYESVIDTEEVLTNSFTGEDTVSENIEAFVWADDGNGRIEKRPVVLGEYDAMLDQYEIVSGLNNSDLIAWPMPGIYEGIITVTNEEDVDYSSGLYNQEDTEMLNEDWDSDMMLEDEWDSEMMFEDEWGSEMMLEDEWGTEMSMERKIVNENMLRIEDAEVPE